MNTTAREPELLLRMLVVYKRPRDMPGHIVVRGCRVYRGNPAPRMEPGAIAFEIGSGAAGEELAIDKARHHCRALGLMRLDRRPDDDPAIFEVWT